MRLIPQLFSVCWVNIFVHCFSERVCGKLFWVKTTIYLQSNLIFNPLTNDGINWNLIAFSFPTI